MAGWFQVFKVDSFVFFGTANTLYQQLKAHISKQKVSKPKAERTKYLIFDLTEVTGIDSSARNVFYKVHRLLQNEGIKLVWAITNPKVEETFNDQGLYVGATHFDSLDLALRHVEDELLLRARHLSGKWLVNETVRGIFQRQGEKKYLLCDMMLYIFVTNRLLHPTLTLSSSPGKCLQHQCTSRREELFYASSSSVVKNPYVIKWRATWRRRR